MSGTATIVWVTGSALGARKAETTKMPKMAVFHFWVRNAGVARPMATKAAKTSGNSKITPKIRRKLTVKLKYPCKVHWGMKWKLRLYRIRNWRAMGITTK